jgi:AcrR family transcriptional regulator
MSSPEPTRVDRRKARTRAALVAAARRILERSDGSDVSIQEITDSADVGFGSFYNHFNSKAELFDAAVAETLEEYAALIDAHRAGVADPAEVFARGVRLTLRLYDSHRQIAGILLNTGSQYLLAENGPAPRALRDMLEAEAAGRFVIGDPAIALASTGGALLGVLYVLEHQQAHGAGAAADQLARQLLQMFGLTMEDAADVVSRPLPGLEQH